ncbi:ATJ10 [Symbiodinium natans]|uniref:ATJ10 protein n=1 Tax=Symbiodinium natans TaxID=878477 RepID=A0A812MX90_9DINO|nr:ATJ10 [Symbiodinium natans]
MARDTHPEGSSLSSPFPADVVVYDAEHAARHEALALRLQEQQEREQAEVEMLKAAVGSVFSVRKPRDAVAGTASGLKTMARGVGVGLASLVVQPYVGAKCGGIKGFAKGCGTGLATCVGSTVAGTVVGSGQIVRGVVNTPGAILRTARGEVWNSETRKWEKDWYSLPEEAAEVLCQDDEEACGESRARTGSSRKVHHTELYDILGVRPEASEAEIRRAFYKKSLALHPDKNPDNPEATKQFQAVSDAYRILGDEERRRAYDELGKDTAAANLPKIEPVVFFAALFGTHHFEPFVGRLRLAQDIDTDMQLMMRDIIAAEDEESGQIDALKVSRAHKRMQALERRRQVQCAVTLASRLDEARLQEEGRWEAEQRAEAKRLSQVPSGVEMLYLIGWLYVNGAEQWLAGSAAARMVAKMQAKAHLLKSKGELAASAGRTAITVNSIMKTAERKKTKSQSSEPKEGKDAMGRGAPSSPARGKETASEDSRTSQNLEEAHEEVHDEAGSSRACPSEGRESVGSRAEEKRLSPGTVVALCNLRTQTELNGEVGVIEEFDASSGRYVVHLLSEGLEPRRIRAENLLIMEDPARDDASGGSASSTAPAPGKPDRQDTSEDAHWAPGGEDAEIAEAFKDTMPLFHETLWKVTAIDIEYTLAKVVRRVLRDMSVDKSARQHRAEALRRLGAILQEPLRERNADLGASRLSLEGREAPPVERRVSSRSSILARLPRVSWRSRKSGAKEARTKEQEAKQKQMEAALVLMAAGASTEDVDEMLAARSAMESELDPFHNSV